MKIKPPSFILIPFQLLSDDRVKPMDEKLYGFIYWLSKLKNEKCTASNDSLAELLKTTKGVVQSSLLRLERRGYVIRKFKDRNRKLRDEIIPLIDFTSFAPAAPPREPEPRPEPPPKVEEKVGGEVNEVINLFEPMNPSYERLFSNKTQRASIERMLKKMGRDKLEKAIVYAVRVHGAPFAPRISTPLQLETKMGDLVSHFKTEKQKGSKTVTI